MPNKDYVNHSGPVPSSFHWPAVRSWMQRMSRITETRDVMSASPVIRCRAQVASSTVTVLAAKNVESFVRQAKGRYTMTSSYPFDEDFTFEFMGTCKNDFLQEIGRTTQSVTFVTGSGEDGADMDVQMVQVDVYNLGTSPTVLTTPWTMAYGQIDGNTAGGFTPASPSVGASFAIPDISDSLAYAPSQAYGFGYHGAIAFADAGIVESSVSLTFTAQNEANRLTDGVMVGCRWNNAGQTGVFAFAVPGTGTTGALYLVEMFGGSWAYVQGATAALTMTSTLSYTITLTDSGTGLTATVVDDSGTQSASITTSNGNTNTQLAYGWLTLSLTTGTAYASTISATPV